MPKPTPKINFALTSRGPVRDNGSSLASGTASVIQEEKGIEVLARRFNTTSEEIGLNLIVPNPQQPRKSFQDIEVLAHSIGSVGLLQPVSGFYRPDGKFVLVAGERRFRACLLLGTQEFRALYPESRIAQRQRVPACVLPGFDEVEMLRLALMENMQRRDLTVFEEADSVRLLTEELAFSHEAMSRELNISRSRITKLCGISRLSAEVRAVLADTALAKNFVFLFSLGQVTNKEQLAVATQAVSEQWTNKELKQYLTAQEAEQVSTIAQTEQVAATPSSTPLSPLLFVSEPSVPAVDISDSAPVSATKEQPQLALTPASTGTITYTTEAQSATIPVQSKETSATGELGDTAIRTTPLTQAPLPSQMQHVSYDVGESAWPAYEDLTQDDAPYGSQDISPTPTKTLPARPAQMFELAGQEITFLSEEVKLMLTLPADWSPALVEKVLSQALRTAQNPHVWLHLVNSD